MIVLTGGAGFIGSNVLRELNLRGIDDVVVVDDLTDGRKFSNIVDAQFSEYLDKDKFRTAMQTNSSEFAELDCIIHLGACSDTTEWDGKYMLDINYNYSKEMLDYCVARDIRMVYASSAAVYGLSSSFAEQPENEMPLNVYGYSKLLFDRYVRKLPEEKQRNIAGLRYFNVYGPRESHKGKMASVFFHFHHQLERDGGLKLFAGSHGCEDGEHRRDFIYVDDAVDVTLWMVDNRGVSGIFNCGTGRAETFNQVARSVLSYHESGELSYVPMPTQLHAAYQSYTCADLAALRKAGYSVEFLEVEQGARRYLDWLTGNI